MNYHAAPRGKICPLIVFQRNVLNFFSAKFILQIMLTNFPKPSWPPSFFTVAKEVSLITERCRRLLNVADLGTEWIKQAYKTCTSCVAEGINSPSKKNGTCDISALSQHVHWLPANDLLGWGAASAPSWQGQKRTTLPSPNLGGFYFFSFSLPPANLCLILPK